MDQGDGVVVPKTLNYSQGLGTTAVFYFLNESPHTYVFKVIEAASRFVPIKKKPSLFIPLTASSALTRN